MISNEFIAKIEGHGKLNVDWQKNQVELKVLEGERLFEGILKGRTAEEAHWITPRICGICPIAHNLASLAAIEAAYEIEINKTSRLLREIMTCGQMIQSHVLHLFFLALPDYLGLDRGTELAKRAPQSFKRALALKELADEIAYVVAGRNVHPTTTAIGGFHKIPDKKDLERLLKKLQKTTSCVKWTADFFEKLNYPKLKIDLEFIAQNNGEILSSKNDKTSIKNYKTDIEEEIKDYSTAKFARYKKREVMVGALARLALLLMSTSDVDIGGVDFQNPFHNNLAQAIEIKLFHKRAMEIVKELLDSKMDASIKTPSVEERSGKTLGVGYKGIGAVEAPRGGLYHEIHLNPEGVITYANIITPTVQNLTSIEKSAKALLEQTRHLTDKKREKLIEMLIRAYDPCITCAVH